MKRFVAILLLTGAIAYGAKWQHFSPTFNTGANDTVLIIGTGDDTTGAFMVTPYTSFQVEIVTAYGDTSSVGAYPVYASKAPYYIDCGSVPISKFRSKWGSTDSTDFYGVYDGTHITTGFSIGANLAPSDPCPCARIVVKGKQGNDSSKVVVHISRFEQ